MIAKVPKIKATNKLNERLRCNPLIVQGRRGNSYGISIGIKINFNIYHATSDDVRNPLRWTRIKDNTTKKDYMDGHKNKDGIQPGKNCAIYGSDKQTIATVFKTAMMASNDSTTRHANKQFKQIIIDPPPIESLSLIRKLQKPYLSEKAKEEIARLRASKHQYVQVIHDAMVRFNRPFSPFSTTDRKFNATASQVRKLNIIMVQGITDPIQAAFSARDKDGNTREFSFSLYFSYIR